MSDCLFWCFCVFLVCIWECWLGLLNSYEPIFDGESSHEVRFSIGGHISEYGASQGFGNQFSQWSSEVENRGFSKIPVYQLEYFFMLILLINFSLGSEVNRVSYRDFEKSGFEKENQE